MKTGVKWLVAVNLLLFAFLAFAYPDLMVSPGHLTPAHASLEKDCFACHSPFRGTDSGRCQSCHEISKIGKFTTAGKPLEKSASQVAFHQSLKSADCTGCHSDHAGVRRFRTAVSFDHGLLADGVRTQCQSCHQPPQNALHKNIDASCNQCHRQDKWKPATFDHSKYFLLDRDHDVECTTCHIKSDFSQYTCFGCHEHTPAGIRAEHWEEGIRDFDNCAECHKSANEHDIRIRNKQALREIDKWERGEEQD